MSQRIGRVGPSSNHAVLRWSMVCLCVLWGQSARGDEIVYRCEFRAEPNFLFPQSESTEQIVDNRLKGFYDDKSTKASVTKTQLLLKKRPVLTAELRQTTDGSSFAIELLNINLPSGTPQIRHEVFHDGIDYWWMEVDQDVVSTGNVNKGWSGGLIWPPMVRLLLGYVPTGVRIDKPGLAANEAAFLEPVPSSVTSDDSDSEPLNGQRNFVIRYVDRERTRIGDVAFYWNLKAKDPFCRVRVAEGRVVGNEVQFTGLAFERHSGAEVIWTESMRVLRRSKKAALSLPKIPVGQMFQDRRLGEERQYTFFYDGRRFPTELEMERDLAYGKQNSSRERPGGWVAYAIGGLLVAFGVLLAAWLRLKSSSKSPEG